MFQPSLAFESLQQQRDYGDRALRQLLAYLKEQSPFYRRLFAATGVDPVSITGLAQLPLLPTTSKDDMQQYNADFLCAPRSALREYMATSGTLGRPVSLALTEGDLRRLAYNEAQSFRTAGAAPGELYQLALTLDRQFMAGAAYYAGLRELGAASVRTGPGLPAMQWETIQRLQPDALVAVPSFLLKMLDWAAENGIDAAASSVKKVVCIGESLRRPDLGENALAAAIRERWKVALHGTYAATELQTAFTECSAGVGGHLQPDLIILEILDESGAPLPDGQPGEVTVTTLGVEGMPLLRFRTGDIAARFSDPCVCGRLSPRLGPVIGRRQQMIKYKGTKLYPPAVFDLLNGAAYISDYVVEASSDGLGGDVLRILVSSDLAETELQDRLGQLFQSGLRVKPEIRLVAAEALPALQQPSGSRKLSRFVDKRAALS